MQEKHAKRRFLKIFKKIAVRGLFKTSIIHIVSHFFSGSFKVVTPLALLLIFMPLIPGLNKLIYSNTSVFLMINILITIIIFIIIVKLFRDLLNFWSNPRVMARLRIDYPEVDQQFKNNSGRMEKESEFYSRKAEILNSTQKYLNNFRTVNFSIYSIYIAIIASLMATLALGIDLHYGKGFVFHGIQDSDGLLAYFYYYLVTLITLGYGDIHPQGVHGHIYGIFACLQSIIFFSAGLGLIISQSFQVLNTYRNEISEFLMILLPKKPNSQ